MEVTFTPRFLAQLKRAEAEDPDLAETLRDVMAKMRQAAEGAVTQADMLAAMARLGAEIEPVDEDEE